MKIPKKRNYLNNRDMLIEVQISKAKGQISDNLVNMLMILCDRYSKKSNYANYSYIEDMRSCALLNLCKMWASFDAEKSQNPFSYYTQAIKHSFVQFLNQEKKQRQIRDLLLIDTGLDPSFTFLAEYNEEYHNQPNEYHIPIDEDDIIARKKHIEHLEQIERLELIDKTTHMPEFEYIIEDE